MKNGGPAFPCVEEVKEVTERGFGTEVFKEKVIRPGMTLRDYFAAKAMPIAAVRHGSPNSSATFVHTEHIQSMAKDAYLIADAMIAARES